jgi:hypothetical protein
MYGKAYFIQGTNLEYSLTRRFVEEVNEKLNGSGKSTAAMVVNSLGERNDFISEATKAKVGKFLNVVLNGTIKITVKKEDVDELRFINMKIFN